MCEVLVKVPLQDPSTPIIEVYCSGFLNLVHLYYNPENKEKLLVNMKFLRRG